MVPIIEITFKQRDAETGEREQFSNDSRDTYRWEVTDKANRAFLEVFTEGTPKVSDLYRLAHITAKRLGLVDKKLDLPEYVDRYVVEVEFEEASPTDGGPGQDE